MAPDLSKAWTAQPSSRIPATVAKSHLQALASETAEIEPVVHCDLYGGLLKGTSLRDYQLDTQLVGVLMELEAQGRTIVILHTRQDREVDFLMQRYIPGVQWETQNRLTSGREWADRSRGHMPKAELMIHADENFGTGDLTHVSTVKPEAFAIGNP